MNAELVDDAQALVPSISIENLVQQRDACLERANQAAAMLREGCAIAVAGGFGYLDIGLMAGYSSRVQARIVGNYDGPSSEVGELMRREIDRGVWRKLMNESGLFSLMDAKAREQWNETLDKGPIPVVSRETIETTFRQLFDSRADIFDRGVINVFQQLSWDYKTNLPQKFGKRIILTGVLHYRLQGGWGTTNHSVTDRLDDLQRVMSVIDGKPEPDHRVGWHQLVCGALLADKVTANDYMSMRLHKNGNGHVQFLRPDLVDAMNDILAKHYPAAIAGTRGTHV